MRFLNTIRNSIAAFGGQIVTILLGFGIRWIFIRSLGQEFLGVNSVMESVLTLLSMTELGIGSSIAFALYEPIDKGDIKRVGSLMAFYRKVYHLVGIVTAVLGVALIPFMSYFTREAAQVSHMTVIYLLFLLNTVLSYFFAYKSTLLSANQKHYINSMTEDGFAVVKYILQAVALFAFRSYMGYLIINLLCTLAVNLVISAKCDKEYPEIKQYKNEKLYPEDKKLLKKSVISLMYQKIGGKLVTGTDNLMISSVNIVLMGVYSNYAMVISIIDRVVGNVLKAVTGSVGSLMVQEDGEKKYKVYEEMNFISFAGFFFISAVLAGCLERFVFLLGGGEEWVLSHGVTFVVIMNFYFQGTRQPNIAVIDAAGIFNEMRPKAVFEVVVNLVVSFLFLIVFKMGIYGVLLGTTVSKIGVCLWWEPWAVHKYSFGRHGKRYTLKFIRNAVVTAAGCFLSFFAAELIPVGGIAGLFLCGFSSAGIFAVIFLPLYIRTEEFKGVLKRFVKI